MIKELPVKRIVHFLIELLFTGILLTVAGFAVAAIFPDNSVAIYEKYAPLFSQELRVELRPEPVEKMIYGILCLLSPLIIWFSLIFTRKIFASSKPALNDLESNPRSIWIGGTLILLGTLCCFLCGLDFLYFTINPVFERKWLWLPCFLLVFILCRIILKCKFNQLWGRKWWWLAIFPLVVSILFSRLYFLAFLPPNTYHVEFLLYSTARAAAGNLEWHLYGNYHWMLSPLFMIIKPSIFNFSAVMGILYATAFMSVVYFGSRFIKNWLLLFLMVFYLILLVSWGRINFNYFDPYFQYHPLRTLWPTVSLLILYGYFKSSRKIIFCVLAGVCCAVSLFWNLESGIPVSGAFAFFFAAESVFPKIDRRKFKFMLVFIAALLAGVFLLYAAFCVCFGALVPPQFFWEGHAMYLKTGFWALPMPKIGMWLFFAGIYVTALSWGIREMILNRQTYFSRACVFLAILGIGLFSYYQSRSHIWVLSGPVYTAVLLLFIFADRTFRMSKNDKKMSGLALTGLVPLLLGVCALLCISFSASEILDKSMFSLGLMSVDGKDSIYHRRIDFIKQAAGNRGRINIIGDYQGIYYAESGLTPGISNFNQQEIYTIEQNQLFSKKLQESDCPLILAPRGDRFYYIDPAVLKYYKLIAVSEEGNLKYYEPLKNLPKSASQANNGAKN